MSHVEVSHPQLGLHWQIGVAGEEVHVRAEKVLQKYHLVMAQ